MLSNNLNVAIIGAGGAIGSEFVRQLAGNEKVAFVMAFSRVKQDFSHAKVESFEINIEDEVSISEAAKIATREAALDLVIVATGMLHDESIMPEKSLRDLSKEKFQQLFNINTIAPAIIAKHFVPRLNKAAILAFLSARVGSISDNYLGGWYAYRSSKAALNMIIKNIAIELSRSKKSNIVVGLHPGTVASELSRPFQSSVKEGKLFSPEYSVQKLLEVVFNLSALDSGKVVDFNGIKIES